MSTRRIYKFHKWSGLIAGFFILLLGLTGSILAFHEELESLENRAARSVNSGNPVNINRALQTVITSYPGWDTRLLQFSSDPKKSLVFQLRRPDDRLVIFVHPSEGKIIKVTKQEDSRVFWILKLHYSLHSGIIGEIILFLAGLLFIISLITGLVVYRKALFKVLTFRTRFISKHKRSVSSSLHRYIGVWALIFNLIMALTGTVISYEVVKNGLKAQKTAPLSNPSVTISIDSTLKELAVKQPQFTPSYIRFPTAPGNPVIFAGRLSDQAYFYSKFYNTISVDAISGKISELQITRSLSSLVRGIHFIEYGNLFIKLFFCLVGLSAPLLSITGFLLWKWKKK
ncbi:PepSY domain-containing protein [Flavihumibacter sp. R14]|nr:PepSY domain-containing protein [Flavihumibacter soli]